jgi:hypothetical protein
MVELIVATLSALLVTVTVAVAGAGYGVWYRPVDDSVPGLCVEPDGPLRVHTYDRSPGPLTETLNWTEPPTVTVGFDGVSTIVTADLYFAVTVVFAATVSVQELAVVAVQPLHPLKTSLPSELGALNVTTVPAA